MDTIQLSNLGAMFFLYFNIFYLVVFFVIQILIFKRRKKKAEQFCERAKQDGRMVIAKRVGSRVVSYDMSLVYIGKYIYTAPNGKEYRIKYQNPNLREAPETLVLYLERWNYRIYYVEGFLDSGKYYKIIFFLSLAAGFAIYLALMYFIIMPLLTHM